MWIELLLAIGLVATLIQAWKTRPARPRGRRPFAPTGTHYRRLYTRRNFLKLGGAIAGASALVYSGVDETVDEWHANQVRGKTSNAVADVLHEFGERYWFFVWLGFTCIDHFVSSTAVTRWGRQSFESMVVGLPTLWTVQRTLGASRPNESEFGPRYKPFDDDNAASGHTFLAAIPCLVAAQHLGAPAPRTVAYALSPWVGWSRMNDRKHYLSQVLLGYGIAWEAVKATRPEPGSASEVPAPTTPAPQHSPSHPPA